MIEKLRPPDGVVSTLAGLLDKVRERLVYYIPDRGRMENIWIAGQGGLAREVWEFQEEFSR